MPESADSLDTHEVARPRAAMPQRVEGRDSGAHQRRRFFRPQRVGNMRERLDRRNHVRGVAAVITDSGDLQEFAIDKIAAPAWIASKAVPAMPSDADAVADFPFAGIFAERLDHARQSHVPAIADS